MPAQQPAMHGRDHCAGGSDPIPCLGQVGVLTGWEAIDSGEIPAGDWYPVIHDGFYNDGYPGVGFAVDLDAGLINGKQHVMNWAIGWVQIIEILAPGEILAVSVVDEGQGEDSRIINQLTAGAAGALSDHKVSVAAPLWNNLAAPAYSLYVYHDSASTVTIRGAALTVHSVGPLFPGTWVQHDP